MEFGSERYYKNSGAAPVGGILLSLGIGVAAGALLAFGYAFINWYNPIVYVTVLATCGMSVVTGMGVVFGLTLGKVRNQTLGAIIGLVSGLFTLYFAWTFYLWVVSDYAGWVFNPTVLLGEMREIGKVGLWSIKGGTPTGWGLYTFWIIEAGIIVVGPVLVAWMHDNPFCESCNEWADEHACGSRLQLPADLNELKRDLEDEQYTRLHELMQGGASADNHLQIKIWMCPACDESTWLSVEQVVTTTNGKGESNTSTTAVVKNLHIPRDLANDLVSAIPGATGGAEAILTDIPESERNQPGTIPLAGDNTDDADDDEDFWNTKKS